MHPAASRLKRCGPLTDTLRVAGLFLKSGMVFACAGPPLLFGIVGLLHKESALTVAALGYLAGGALLGLILSFPSIRAYLLVLRESKHPRHLCLFLRAFRSDATSDQLRAWLKAGLGRDYQLSGIRPPRERASPLATLLSPLLTGLRYAGSRQFELEAPSRNWMARLLATCAEARLVFMDVRQVTPHVMDEVLLAWNVFGPARVIFIIDDSKSAAEWKEWIGGRVGDAKESPLDLKLLTWPAKNAPDPAAFLVSVQALMNQIPDGTPEVTEESVAFVEARMKPEDWDLRFIEKPWAFVMVSLVTITLLFLGLRLLVPDFVYEVATCGLLLVFQVMFWVAWNRARKQRRLVIQINPQGPPSAGRLIEAALWMVLTLVVTLLLVLLALTDPFFVARPTAILAMAADWIPRADPPQSIKRLDLTVLPFSRAPCSVKTLTLQDLSR